MKVTLSKSEAAKLLKSPVPGYTVVSADWTVRKDGDVEIELAPDTKAPELDASTEARR